MKPKENEGFRTALRLLGPLVFYELCMETAAWACSLFYTQNALLETGMGALLAFPFLLAAYRKKTKPCPKQMHNLDFGAGCLFSALAGAGACLCLNFAVRVFFHSSDGWNDLREMIYGSSFFIRFLVTVILAPAVEELIFRGLIRLELRRYMSARGAALAGAALFGLYHGNLSQGIYAFLLGLCMEGVCGWSSSVIPALFLHVGANAAALAFTALTSALPKIFGTQAVSGSMVMAGIAAGACLMAAALYKTKEVFCKL